MNFLFLGIFPDFYEFYFRFKLIKKIAKTCLFIARVPRGCDVALRATWQRHADPRSAYVAQDIYFIFIYYRKYKWSSAFPIWEGLLTLQIVGSYKPDECF